jgi:hypothetical protein
VPLRELEPELDLPRIEGQRVTRVGPLQE